MKLPRGVSGGEVVKVLKRAGFSVKRQRGSHVRLVKGSRRVTVPIHANIDPGTLSSILDQAEMSLEAFKKHRR